MDDVSAGTLVCRAADGSRDLTREQERLYQSLLLLKQLQFDAPLPWTPQSVWEWFVGDIDAIEVVSTGLSSCCGPPGTMHLAAAQVEPSGFPTDVFGIVHEARHADGKLHDCGSRDETIAELGAFGVEYYFALWVADHVVAPNLTTAERDYARMVAADLRGGGGAFCAACGGI